MVASFQESCDGGDILVMVKRKEQPSRRLGRTTHGPALLLLLLVPAALAQKSGSTTTTTGNTSWSTSTNSSTNSTSSSTNWREYYYNAPLHPNRNVNYSSHALRLRTDLLDASRYDKAVVATSNLRNVSYVRTSAGTDVSMQIRFFKVDAVEAALGTLRVKVWWRSSWADTRLAWDPAEYGGITEIKMFASTFADPETTECASELAPGAVMWTRCLATLTTFAACSCAASGCQTSPCTTTGKA
jgi:hypothetical protein